MTGHTRNIPNRCVTISDDDDAVIRRAGNGKRAAGIRELVRVYVEANPITTKRKGSK